MYFFCSSNTVQLNWPVFDEGVEVRGSRLRSKLLWGSGGDGSFAGYRDPPNFGVKRRAAKLQRGATKFGLTWAGLTPEGLKRSRHNASRPFEGANVGCGVQPGPKGSRRSAANERPVLRTVPAHPPSATFSPCDSHHLFERVVGERCCEFPSLRRGPNFDDAQP